MYRERPDIDAHWNESRQDVCIEIHSNGDYSTTEIHKEIERSIPVGKLTDIETVTRVVKNLFKDKKSTTKATKKVSTSSNKKSNNKSNKKVCMAKKPTEFKKDTTYNLEQLEILVKIYARKSKAISKAGSEAGKMLKTIKSRISYYKRK